MAKGSGGASGQTRLGGRTRKGDYEHINFDKKEVQKEIKRLFGRTVDADTLAKAAGAFKGSKVQFSYNKQEGLLVSVRNKNIDTQDRFIRKDKDGLYIYNDSFVKSSKSKESGLGAKMLSIQARSASRLGIKRIDTEAAGTFTGKYNGYYTWPRLGYNATIPRKFASVLPSKFKSAKTVGDLFKMPGGRVWWKVNGGNTDMSFDLTKGSQSRKILSSYLKEKRKK